MVMFRGRIRTRRKARKHNSHSLHEEYERLVADHPPPGPEQQWIITELLRAARRQWLREKKARVRADLPDPGFGKASKLRRLARRLAALPQDDLMIKLIADMWRGSDDPAAEPEDQCTDTVT